jgi:probable F420-dependent oxidoreductase
VKLDTNLAWPSDVADPLVGFGEQGRAAEAVGYHGLWSAETAHDPFLPLVAAAQATTTIEVGTAITVAFARNPMSLAYTAYDLQLLTGGRFVLGLGSQVRPHIERRFDMPWSRPAARMREFIAAMRAIWSAWSTGDKLEFHGEFYSHTLMTPFFAPAPSQYGAPSVYLAAVGEAMTDVAGSSCDGLLPHPFTTERYMREVTVPTIERALSRSGKTRGEFSICFQGLVATGRTQEQMDLAIRRVREQIAFYASTPAYEAVLTLHGWDDLGRELGVLARNGEDDRRQRMGELIDDEILTTFCVVAEADQLGAAIAERFGGVVDRFSFYAPYEHDELLWQPAIRQLSVEHGDRVAVHEAG